MQRSTRGFHDLKQVCKPLTLLSVWLTCLTGENISNKAYLKLTKYFALIAEKIFWQIILSNSSFIFISHTQKNAIEDRDKVRNPLLFSSLPTKTKWRLLRSSRSPSGRLSCRANCPPPQIPPSSGPKAGRGRPKLLIDLSAFSLLAEQLPLAMVCLSLDKISSLIKLITALRLHSTSPKTCKTVKKRQWLKCAS